MSRNDRLQATALKNQWKAQLASLPTKEVALMVAQNMLPETAGEALIETGLAAATGVGTYIVVGALTPALLATGAALGAVAAYNLKTKSDGEIKELVQRVKGWTISKVKSVQKDEVVIAAPQTKPDKRDQVIDELRANEKQLRERLARLEAQSKPEPKVIVEEEVDLSKIEPVETVDLTTLDVAQWAKEE